MADSVEGAAMAIDLPGSESAPGVDLAADVAVQPPKKSRKTGKTHKLDQALKKSLEKCYLSEAVRNSIAGNLDIPPSSVKNAFKHRMEKLGRTIIGTFDDSSTIVSS